MTVFLLFFVLIAFAKSICASTQDSLATGYVLTFSSTTISATRYNDSGSLETFKFSTGREYQHYYSNVLRNLISRTSYPKDHIAYYRWTARENEVAIFHHEAATINTTLSQLGHSLYYAAVMLPPFFDGDTQLVAEQAFLPVSSGYGILKSASFRRIASGGFGFFECKHIGRQPEECNGDDGPETMIFQLQYEKDYLHIALQSIAWEWEGFYTHDEETCFECGEQFQKVRCIAWIYKRT
jgi:hypothetical protein